MSRFTRLLGLVALSITAAWLLRWLALPDGHAPVRLAPPAPHEQVASAAEASEPPQPPCTEADLAAWAMPTPTDPHSPFVTLYSQATGARRVALGATLSPQVVLERVSATEVVVACTDGHLRRTLRSPEPASAPVAPRRLAAPLGN